MRRAMAILLALVCAGCSSSGASSDSPGHDEHTELRREHDCANPQWKQANLGLWYNVCRPDAFR
jgi:hypothetical protein